MEHEDELVAAIAEAEKQALKVLAENEEAQKQFFWVQQNRIGLLWSHGLSGLFVGSLMLVFGTPSNFEATLGIWIRTLLGLMGVLGGATIIFGLTRRPLRSIKAEGCGLAILALWDIIILASFILLLFLSPPHAAWPWDAIGEEYSRPYPVGIYATLLLLLLVHLYTLSSLLHRRYK